MPTQSRPQQWLAYSGHLPRLLVLEDASVSFHPGIVNKNDSNRENFVLDYCELCRRAFAGKNFHINSIARFDCIFMKMKRRNIHKKI